MSLMQWRKQSNQREVSGSAMGTLSTVLAGKAPHHTRRTRADEDAPRRPGNNMAALLFEAQRCHRAFFRRTERGNETSQHARN